MKTAEGKQLKFNFKIRGSKLEIKERERWIEVSPDIFRSWGGERKINGEPFVGDVYYLWTNEIVR